MFNTDLAGDWVNRALRLANMGEEEIRTTQDVEGIFEGHLWQQERALIWHKIAAPIADPTDTAGYKDLRNTLRGWLRTLAAGHWADAVKDRDEALARYKQKATLDADIKFTATDGKPGVLKVPLWGLPYAEFDENNRLNMGAIPLVTGVESAVYFAVILIFAASAGESIISICEAPRATGRGSEKGTCGKFFIPTKERRAACSDYCYTLHRRAQVNKSALNYWKEHPRSNKKGGKKSRRKRLTGATKGEKRGSKK